MKKLLDVAHGKLINIIGRHGNLDQYSWMSVIPLNDHLLSSKTIAIVRDCNSIVQVAKNTMKNHFKNINVHFINLHSPQRPGKLFLFEVLTEEN